MQQHTPQRRQAILREAEKLAKRAIGVWFLCSNDLPQALREYATILAMQGRLRKSRRVFAKAIHAATRLKERQELAKSLLAAAAVGAEAGWPEATSQRERGELLIAEMLASGES